MSDDPDARKSALRERCWAALERAGVDRPPGATGRIPNFEGARAAAERLAQTAYFQAAPLIKCNPDTPQRHVRFQVLQAGKQLLMAIPRLADTHPFVLLDGREIDPADRWDAASKSGAIRRGRPVTPAQIGIVTLIVCGAVGVTREGARLGKGGGFADLEFALLRGAHKLANDVPVVTTVHPLQCCAPGSIPMSSNDVPLSLWCTPDETVMCARRFPRPTAIETGRLTNRDLRAMPPVAAHIANTRRLDADDGEPEST